jgi:hypothetical protein
MERGGAISSLSQSPPPSSHFENEQMKYRIKITCLLTNRIRYVYISWKKKKFRLMIQKSLSTLFHKELAEDFIVAIKDEYLTAKFELEPVADVAAVAAPSIPAARRR